MPSTLQKFHFGPIFGFHSTSTFSVQIHTPFVRGPQLTAKEIFKRSGGPGPSCAPLYSEAVFVSVQQLLHLFCKLDFSVVRCTFFTRKNMFHIVKTKFQHFIIKKIKKFQPKKKKKLKVNYVFSSYHLHHISIQFLTFQCLDYLVCAIISQMKIIDMANNKKKVYCYINGN